MFKHNNYCLLLHALSVCTFSTLHQIFIHTGKTPKNLQFSRPNSTISVISLLYLIWYMLLSPYLLHDSSVDLLQYDHASLRNSELDLALQRISPGLKQWMTSLDLLMMLFPNKFRVLLAFFGRRRQICTVSVVILLCDYIALYYRTRAGFWKSQSCYAEIFVAKSSQLSGQLYLVQGCRVN